MRIAQVRPSYHPAIGGVESVVRELSQRLSRKGFEVDRSFWQGHNDAMFKAVLGDFHGRLDSEYKLLQRIVLKFLPSDLKEATSNLDNASRKLRVTVEILFYFSFGHVSYLIPRLIRITKKLV